MAITRCLTPKHIIPKLCAVMVSALMFSACQSHQQIQTTTQQSVIPSSAKALFDNSGQSLSTQAKNELLAALQAHMASERFAVSTHYYQVAPIDHQNSVDKDASDIWTSAIKLNEYRQTKLDSEYQDKSFRRAIDYLYPSDDDKALGTDLGELPYLRYDDEMDNNTVETVTRSVGMSDDYAEVSDEIWILGSKANDCVRDADSRIMDQLEYPSDQRNTDFKNIFNNCQADIRNESDKLMSQAKGYQIQDLTHINRCLSDYQTGLNDIIKAKQPKTSNQNHTPYDVLYENYQVCRSSHTINQRLEPANYTKGTSEIELQANQALKMCLNTYLTNQSALYTQGKNYSQHINQYTQNYVDYANCSASAITPFLKNKKEPEQIDNFSDAKYLLRDIEYQIEYDLDEGEDNYTKYRGIAGWFNLYRDMKNQKNTDNKNDEQITQAPSMSKFGIYGNMLGSMLDYIKQTPEQIIAQNLYQYNHTSITSLSHHNPQQQQSKLLFSLDFKSPTATQSAQLPIGMDFKQGVITADVSAMLPFVALISPKHALLPQDIPNGQMTFRAPKELAQKIPSSVIYDAIIAGINKGYQSISSEKFTLIDAHHDLFAKEVGAKRVIKLELGSKEFGIFYATIVKQVVADLKAFVDANPQLYPDVSIKDDNKDKESNHAEEVKKIIDDFALINTAYRTSDVGGLLQMIEGILPLSFDGTSYMYLDSKGKLIAMQNVVLIDSEMDNLRSQSVNQIRYDKTLFDKHPLNKHFTQTFTQAANFDGNAWIGGHFENYRLKRQAQAARSFYDYDSELPTIETEASIQDTNKAEQVF